MFEPPDSFINLKLTLRSCWQGDATVKKMYIFDFAVLKINAPPDFLHDVFDLVRRRSKE